jgi:hypothetical protein
VSTEAFAQVDHSTSRSFGWQDARDAWQPAEILPQDDSFYCAFSFT